MSASSSFLKKELHISHFEGIFQKLWNKANKKAVSAFRTFLEKCLRWSLFLEKLQTSACNLNTNQLHRSNLQEALSFQKSFVVSEAATGRVQWKKLSLEISHNSQEKTCARVSFSMRWQASDYKLIKKETLAQLFLCELREISKNTFCIEDLAMTASIVSKEFYKLSKSSFQEKISTTAFRLDNLVKRMVFCCYPRDIVGEFPLECKIIIMIMTIIIMTIR